MNAQKRFELPGLLLQAFRDFRNNDPLRMAGATAFFTTFALPAMLIILIQVFGLIVSPRIMTRQLLKNLADIVGDKTASALHQTLINVHRLSDTWWVAAGGFLFLVFVSTTLFKVIRDSLNQLWNIRMKTDAGLAFNLWNRAQSFIVILVTGLLFLAVFLGEGVLNLLNHHAKNPLFDNSVLAGGLVKQLIALLVVTIWFSMVFKFLPGARPEWKVVFAGAFFTGLLFTGGKLLLKWLLSYSNMQTIYGASTSSVLLLLFVFYSSLIFYFGACFTRVWAIRQKTPIQPGKHAIRYEWTQVNPSKAH